MRTIVIMFLSVCAIPVAAQTVAFEDDFEGALSQWALNKSGVTAVDPLDPLNRVLTFQAVNNTYDLRSGSLVLQPGITYVMSFRYLGLPQPGSAPDNFGGAIAIHAVNSAIGWGYTWDTTPCQVTYLGDLIDDGSWHQYELVFEINDITGGSGEPVVISVEDWDGAASACPPNRTVGDVFFDDIRVEEHVATDPVSVTFGTSWDGISLQDILDSEYGPGAIRVDTDYEGYLTGDADPAWWQDLGVNSILIREIAGFSTANSLGWYQDTLSGPPTIDGVDDGLIFTGPMGDGAEAYVEFDAGQTQFGFYLNPQGGGSSCNAPEPERFFTNRFYNDIGTDGSGAVHAPFDGDIQCLIFNITHLRSGVPTYVLAWEDLDSGAALSSVYDECLTDNDYNDMVVEISAFSPVKTESESWGSIKAMYNK